MKKTITLLLMIPGFLLAKEEDWTIPPLFDIPTSEIIEPVGQFFKGSRLVIREENDSFGLNGDDDAYTQALDVSVMFPGGIQWGARNQFYTPYDITQEDLGPDDRPWGGMTGVYKARHREIDGGRGRERREWFYGVVGPLSGSEDIQRTFHNLVGADEPTWSEQLKNEPIFNYNFHRDSKLTVSKLGLVEMDIIGGPRFSVGNAFTHGGIGGKLRLGQNLAGADSDLIIKPTTMGMPDKWSCHVFGGFESRLVLHNIFIDGSLFQGGPGQDGETFVSDLLTGVGVSKGSVSLDFVFAWRGEEYKAQDGTESFGSVRVGYFF